MKIRTRVLAGVASLTLVGGMAALATPAGATAAPPVDVSHSTVTCNSVTGSLKFGAALTITGPTTGASSTTVKAKVAGCTSDDVHDSASPPADLVFGGSSGGTLSGNGGTNCLSLEGTSTSTGTLVTKWTPPKGVKFSPNAVVAGKAGDYTQSALTSEQGGTFAVDGSQAPYAGTYGQFLVGNTYTGVNITDTTANDEFTGPGGNGHHSWINAITNLDSVALLTQCLGTTGIKAITIGIGGLSAG